jgi:Flp pilus assembly pilin Flp
MKLALCVHGMGCEAGAFVCDVAARVCGRAAVKTITHRRGSTMQQFVKHFWRDEAGFVVSTELVLIATILVIGMITGLVTVRDAVVTELADVADAISEVDQSYSYGAITAHCAETAGTKFTDNSDFCELPAQENDQDPAGGAQCVDLCVDNGGGNENGGVSDDD